MRLGVGVGGSTGQGTWGIPLYVIVQWGAVLGQAGTACILATVIWLLVMAGAGAGAWCLLNQRHNREGKHSDKTQQLDFDWGPAVAASSCPGAELSWASHWGLCKSSLCSDQLRTMPAWASLGRAVVVAWPCFTRHQSWVLVKVGRQHQRQAGVSRDPAWPDHRLLAAARGGRIF